MATSYTIYSHSRPHPIPRVLDAYFAAGAVFKTAAGELNGMRDPIHILTRAKKNAAAYEQLELPLQGLGQAT